MNDWSRANFLDLNTFRGLGEDPVYHPPVLTDRPREWPLDQWADAPRDLGYPDFARYQWRGLRMLKDPDTQAAYHDLLWELRPRTVVELGVYSGGSLVWFRDLARLMGLDCQVIGIDKDLSRCQIPDTERTGITLREADCSQLETFEPLRGAAHPLIFIDDAHSNTFAIMKWAVGHLLEEGDYFIVEDMIPYWHRYSPALLTQYLASFRDVLAMDMVYANASSQLDRGVFRRSTTKE
ncbi:MULTISPECIES: CmcI family methyltransferase [Streptomycetaceae]|uniref:Hydroxylase n=2 Tax=Streptantibioticus cattleyicolor TaxID=29303 RepID=F8LFQ4_STREN|nr:MULTISPECIES: CmcI family methyltransferase [Streptomycetaceae]AEW98050.1 hydroxylase [Streptantibioticus cattleyicolor NRRL 8057 = DSM 46488]MYS62444.1 cephalosporin hydroxylase [Streptomyces sp. SID5468]CAQ16372.1 hydroxylase [Streptantibioticus cattleyicolor NRRL 8057 = DSM 46488]CCB78366.1 Cephalosporin-7-alpha-hydroxylase [Streptantibioticus cattleyicolor NRRL 8057 = DSM 46488]CCB84777.1 CmcI hydroxylase [Streptantibioticus cattleyicolor NRRL 8057 = DSM 46488]